MTKLEKAERYRMQRRVDPSERPLFHFTAPVGWINDPNGFSMYRGHIHLFYQYHPFSDAWGPMYWGHAISRDFLSWRDLPVALAPDTPLDAGGCFSGCAVETTDGQQALLYTGTRKKSVAEGRDALQQQCLAMGDGIQYVKYPGNPVIPASELPEGFRGRDFRDPKIISTEGEYRLVAAAADDNGLAHVIEYASADLVRWRLVADLASSDGTYGDMWECPDVFRLDSKDILMVSTMHMPPVAGYHDEFGCVLFAKEPGASCWDTSRGRPVDWGRDFYAAQTMASADGRRVMIAWLQSWDNFIKPKDLRWHGMMSVPRELSWKGGVMCQVPVREIEAWRCKSAELDTRLSGELVPAGLDGRCADIELEVPEGGYGKLTLRVAASGDRAIRIEWLATRRILRVDRSGWSPQGDKYAIQEMPIEMEKGRLSLRILLDTCSLEVFANEGRQVMSVTYYAPEDARGLSLSCDGEALVSMRHHRLRAPGALEREADS